VAFSFGGSAASQTTKKSTEQDEFRSLIDRYYTAWNTGNPDNAAPLYAQDNDLVFYDLTPLKYIGWGAYDAGFRKVIASFASARFTTSTRLQGHASRHDCMDPGDVASFGQEKDWRSRRTRRTAYGNLGESRRKVAHCA